MAWHRRQKHVEIFLSLLPRTDTPFGLFFAGATTWSPRPGSVWSFLRHFSARSLVLCERLGQSFPFLARLVGLVFFGSIYDAKRFCCSGNGRLLTSGAYGGCHLESSLQMSGIFSFLRVCMADFGGLGPLWSRRTKRQLFLSYFTPSSFAWSGFSRVEDVSWLADECIECTNVVLTDANVSRVVQPLTLLLVAVAILRLSHRIARCWWMGLSNQMP